MHRQRPEHDRAGRNDDAEQRHGDGTGGTFERRSRRRCAVAVAVAAGIAALGFAARQAEPMQRQADSRLMAAKMNSVVRQP